MSNPPLPVSARIFAAIEAKLLSLPSVGVTVDVDSAYRAQAGRSGEDVQSILSVIKRPDGVADHAIELECGDSEIPEPNLHKTPTPVEYWEMPVVGTVYFPEKFRTREVEPATDPVSVRLMTPREMAQEFFASVQALFEPLDSDHGGLGGLARYVRVIGGGGVGLDPKLQARATTFVLVPFYCTLRGNPMEVG